MTEVKTEFETSVNGNNYYLTHDAEYNRTYLVKIEEDGEFNEYSCISCTPSWDVLYDEIIRHYDEIVRESDGIPTSKDIVAMMQESYRIGLQTGIDRKDSLKVELQKIIDWA